jgi:hypothetical protein
LYLMWLMSFLNLKVLKKIPQIHKNNAPFKTFKKYAFGTKKLKNKQKLQLVWAYENMVKF